MLKKLSLLAVMPLLVMLVASPGCREPDIQPNLESNVNELVFQAVQADQQVMLGRNDVLVIELEANPSTGYVWENVSSDQNIIRQLNAPTGNQEPEFVFSGKPVVLGAPDSMPGAPATQVLRFVGQSAGRAKLKLAYRKPWEKDQPALKSYSLDVQPRGKFVGKYVPPKAANQPAIDQRFLQASPGAITAPGLPAHFDWREQNVVTPVKNQGSCGSCWAFGAVAAFESQVMMQDGYTPNFSEQYLVSCNYDYWGCSGGWWAHDYHWYRYVSGEYGAGARYESDYPYYAYDYPCYPPHPIRAVLKGWAYTDNVPDGRVPYYNHWPSTATLKQRIYDHGPVATTVCSSTWSYYSGGVFRSHCGYSTHIVLITGWDDNDGAFYIKNSWGTGWGENGYMRLAYGYCLVGYLSTYVKYANVTHGPTAEANGPYAGKPGEPISFSSAGSDSTVVSYLWDFGDGATSTQANPTHTYASEGTFLVTLTVTDNGGLSGSDTAEAFVSMVGCVTSETEPNKGFDAANGPVCSGIPFTGDWVEYKDSDYFFFDLVSTGRVDIRVERTSGTNTQISWVVFHESDPKTYVTWAKTYSPVLTGYFTASKTGRYYLVPYTWGSGGTYTAKVVW